MGKLTLRKSVTSVIVASTLALSVAAGITISHAHKATSNDPAHNQDGDETGQKTNPFENVNTQNVEKTGNYGLIDEYTITFDDGTTSRFIVISGKEGPDAIQAFPNDNGNTPTVRIGPDGQWIINEKETEFVSETTELDDIGPHIGENGNWWIGDTDTGSVAQGENGITPHIGENGNWWLGDVDTGVFAAGVSGADGKSAYDLAVEQGYEGTVDEWLLTLVGRDGKSAYEIMQESGYTGTLEEWFESLAGQDGQNGENGKSAYEVYCDVHEGDDLSEAEWLASLVGAAGNGVTSIEGPVTDGLFDTYTINYTDGNQTQFVVKNGEAGKDGSVTLFGDVDPDELQGVNGDSYINTQTWDYFVKEDNAWVNKGNIKGVEGGQGEQGQAGQNGKSIYAAIGEPEADLGNVGDSYVNVTTGDYYVKDDTGWGDPIGSLKGANGAVGNGIASIALTDDTDATRDVYTITYTDTTTSTFEIAKPRSIVSIVRTSGDGSAGTTDTYTITYNYGDPDTFTVTHGSNGNTILTGEDAPDNSLGRPGDVYVDYVNQDIYLKGIDDWSVGISFKGADGRGIAAIEKSGPEADGLTYTYTITYTDNSTPFVFTVTNGAAGADGLKVVTGNALPTVLTNFQEGDSFIDTTNWNYYVLQSDGADGYEWDYRGNIRGTALYTGHIGDDAPTVEENYKAGDSYLNLDNWNYYVLQDNAGTLEWHLEGNIHNSPNQYTVTFVSNQGTEVDPIDDALEGHPITRPTDPTRNEYYFQGWYTVEGNKWDFTKDVVMGDITLYAHWAQFRVVDGVLVGCSASGDIVVPQFFDGQDVVAVSDTAFKNRTDITSVILPQTITEIQESSFENCTGLLSVSVPKTVRSIGENAFKGCTNLAYAYLEEGLLTIGDSAFENCGSLVAIAIPNSVTSIGEGAFENCGTLTAVVVPDSVTSIGASMFAGCNNLVSITVPYVGGSANGADDQFFAYIFGGADADTGYDSVPESLLNVTLTGVNGDNRDQLPTKSFYGCSHIEHINLSENITVVGNSAFENCSGLKALEFPLSVTNFGTNILKGATAIEELKVPFIGDAMTNTTKYFGYFFGGTNSSNNSTYVPESLKTLEVTGDFEMGYRVLEGCSHIENIIISGTPSEFELYPFYGCTSVKYLYLSYLGNNPTSSYGDLGTFFGGNSIPATLETVIIANGTGANHDELSSSAFKGCPNLENIVLPKGLKTINNEAFYQSKIKNIVIPEGVTSIGDRVFSMCEAESIVISDSVTSIGYESFYKCPKLTYVKIGNGVASIPGNCFYQCPKLFEVVLGNSVTSIGNSAFYSCGNLASINFPDGLTSIGNYAFSGTNLSTVILPGSVETLGSNVFANIGALYYVDLQKCKELEEIPSAAFMGCPALYYVRLQNRYVDYNLTKTFAIGESAFRSCSSLRIVDNLEYAHSIGSYAFWLCISLETIEVGYTSNNNTGATTIQGYAFWQCSGLTYAKFNTNDKYPLSIQAYAFKECTSLKDVNFGDYRRQNYVGSIAKYAFDGCTGVETVQLPYLGSSPTTPYKLNELLPTSSVKTVKITDSINITDEAFYGCRSMTSCTLDYHGTTGTNFNSLGNRAFGSCTNLARFYIPYPVTTIGTQLFIDCASLTEISLKSSFTSIPDGCFKNCSSLVKVNELSGVKSIGSEAFYGCSSLKDINDQIYHANGFDKLEQIGNYAFYNCVSLSTVILRNTVNSIGNYAFQGCDSLESISIPGENATTIGNYAFSNCSHLTYIELKDGVSSIGQYAFQYCTSLKELIVPNSVTTIGSSILSGCNSLESLVIPTLLVTNNNKARLGYVFNGYNSSTRVNSVPNTLKVVVVTGDGPISDYGFSGCANIETIRIEGNPSCIMLSAFIDCTSLKTLSIPYIGSGLSLGTMYAGSKTLNDLNQVHFTWKTTSEFNIFTDPSVAATIKFCYDYEDLYYIDDPQLGDKAFTYGYGNCVYVYEYNSEYDYNDWVEQPSAADYGINVPTLNETDRHIYIGSTDTNYVVPEGNYFDCHYDDTYASPDDWTNPWGYMGYVDINSGKFYFVDATYDVANPVDNDLFVSTISYQCKIFRYVDGAWIDDGLIFASGSEALYGDVNPSNGDGTNGQYYFNTSTKEYFYKVADQWQTNGTLDELYGRFGYWFNGYKNEYDIPESLKTVEITGDMTEIDDDLFRNCAYIEQVILPNTIATIGESAFQDCSSLQSIAFSGSGTHLTIGMRAFFNCTALKTVEFNSLITVDKIDFLAFGGCSKLNEFNPNNALIQEVEQKAFMNCASLETIKFKEGLTRLSHFAFMDCTGLTNVVLPEGLVTIYSYTFSGCTSLTNVVIPSTVKVIDDHAFEQCVSLSGILNLKNVTTIRESAFEGCANISTVIIDVSKLTTLQDNAFKGCDGITAVVIYVPQFASNGEKTSYYRTQWWSGNVADTSISQVGNQAIAYVPYQNGGTTYYYSLASMIYR